MPDTNYQQQLPKRLRPKPIDLMGQCTKCCDLFTVTAFLVPGSEGLQATVSETASLKWVYPHRNQNDQESSPILVHKCTGKVKIYGYSYPTNQHQQEDQSTGAGAARSSSLPRYVLPPSTRRYVTPRAVPQATH